MSDGARGSSARGQVEAKNVPVEVLGFSVGFNVREAGWGQLWRNHAQKRKITGPETERSVIFTVRDLRRI